MVQKKETPISTDSAVSPNMAIKGPPAKSTKAVRQTETANIRRLPVFSAFFALSGFPAPMFCATTVAMPEPKLIMGRRITESTR